MALEAPHVTELALVATALDPDFYLAVNADVAASGVNPVAHYVQMGWREGRDPAPWFCTESYLASNPDIAAAELNPFAHYLQSGAYEGRIVSPANGAAAYLLKRAASGRRSWAYRPPQPELASAPAPVPAKAAAPEGPAQVPAETWAALKAAFDERFYLLENPDVASSGADALTHFLEAGWRENRNPNPWFSVSDYQELNPDVAASGLNPFVHYVQTGRTEGRAARLELGFRHAIIARLPSLEERRAAAEQHDRPHEVGEAEDLRVALSATRSAFARLHLTVSHDDFTANLGGVQLCLQREAAAAAEEGFDHLHLYPVNSRPMLRTGSEAEPLGVVWNGRTLGAFAADTVLSVLAEHVGAASAERRTLALHSLLGHSVSDVLAVTKAAEATQGWFWVHDFAAACVSYHLLRNDVVDCGAPPPESQACALCVYGEGRAFHRAEHQRLFQALDLSVAAPSQVALDTWLRGSAVTPTVARVAPLARLVQREVSPPGPSSDGPFRFAFPGLPGALKGWPVFRELVLRFADDPRYQFLHLARDPSGLPAEFHSVEVSADNPDIMRQTLEEQSVDAVLIWSLCRETFSFTTHEAAAAGAAVLTSPDSGNVAAFVRETGQGLVLPDEQALFALFETGAVRDLSRARRGAATSDLVFSRLTFDLLDEAQP